MASEQRLRCPVHGDGLASSRMISLPRGGETVRTPLFYCGKCGRYYIHTDLVRPGSRFDYGEKEVVNTEAAVWGSSLERLRPAGKRRAGPWTEELSYEARAAAYQPEDPFTLLHYALIFRRFDAAGELLNGLSEEELEEALHFPGPEGLAWLEPAVCAKWNLSYLRAYDDRNGSRLAERLEPYLTACSGTRELTEYTEAVTEDGRDVFAVFWNGKQPLLDVTGYQRQKLAAAQVRHGFSLVMDEVGAGKTVSALYAVQDVLNLRGAAARVLVVCPYNKREDWQNDIRRQLGRFAHIVEQSDPGELYEGKRKNAFFRRNEPVLMIAGQIRGTDANGAHSALKGSVEQYAPGEPWDLAVIDEAHIAFEGYSGLSARRLMLLTATPVVVNAKGRRTFGDYRRLAERILGRPVAAEIDPIRRPLPSEKDVYVNWFREDLGKRSVQRNIRFVSCRRWAGRETAFSYIRKKAGTLAALQYDQDDEYLLQEALRYGLPDPSPLRRNAKLDRLTELLRENEKSYLIFCEHQFVTDVVFRRLKEEFRECVTAEKHGACEEQRGLDFVGDGQLVNTLTQALRSGRRVLFVTTGKSGGAGLNLGEFDGVIHYELPFTSMELEQRFGRVDRIDSPDSGGAKDMIFLLNECRSDENDLEQNRMLYYCTVKIDVTCQYMPVRNTVLYYPEFIRRNGKAIRDALTLFRREYILSEENEKSVRELYRELRKREKCLTEDPLWAYVGQEGKNTRLCAWEALTSPKDDRIPDAYYLQMKGYLEYWKRTQARRGDYQKLYRGFRETRTSAFRWLAAIGRIGVEPEDSLFSSGAEPEVLSEWPVRKGSSVQEQISELLRLLDVGSLSDEALQTFSSDGVFYYRNGRIQRSTVKSFRERAD